MSNIRMSYAEIEQAATRLAQAKDEIAAQLLGQQQQIQQLVTSGFVTDHASVKFESAYNEYTSAATTTVARLDDIQGFLLQAAEAMRNMDAQIAARIH